MVVLWFFVTAIWGLSGWFLYPMETRGTFGDMFGAVNALFSGLAFATLIYTAWMQRDELALQREELAATRSELAGQKAQLEQQTQTFELQRFEDSFYSLLRVHTEIVNAMDLVDGQGRTTRSRDCFRVWFGRLFEFHSRLGVYDDGNELQTVQTVYEAFYSKHQHEIGHYFRTLYHIIKFVDGSAISNKKKYVSLVRAQLSAHEHLLLFYNCLGKHGIQKFKPLVERYALLENLPQDLLLMQAKHIPLFERSAYGEDAARD